MLKYVQKPRRSTAKGPLSAFLVILVIALGPTPCASAQGAMEPMPVSVAAAGFSARQAYELRKPFAWETAYGTGDHNLYSFLNWEEFVPHDTIFRYGPVRLLTEAPERSIGAVTASTSLGEMTVDTWLGDPRSRVQGFIVVQHGRVLYERYPGMRDFDHHLWFSVSKTITALLLGLLEEEGKIDVNRSVEEYLPEFSGTGWHGIRVIDVLDMASGLDLVESEQARNEPGNPVNEFFMQEIGFSDKSRSGDEILLSVEKKGQAGQIFEYSSLNTRMLGLIVERVAEDRLPSLIGERIWSKLGAEGDALVALNPQGQAGMYGLFSSRLRDLVRYGMLYTPSWNLVSSEPIVPRSLLMKIQQTCRPHIYENGDPERQRRSGGFRPRCNSRQWDAVFEDGDIFKGGARGQGLYVSPARDLVIAWFSTTREDGWQHYARAIAQSLN